MIIAIIMKITNIMDKFFLDECLYKIYKCYTMIELKFLKELILIKQVHKRFTFVTIGISSIIVSSFNQMSAINVMIY